MAGTAINPAMKAGMDMGSGHSVTASYVNSFRISAVADRLALHIRNSSQKDIVEFFNLCLSLARGIDYAIANNEVPSRASDLPILLKQVCQRKNDSLMLAAIMVLMISVKNACKKGWFSDKDTGELLNLANEIASSFCSSGDANTEASSFLPTVSTIMSRFYPQLKMGQILASIEVKAGYGVFVIDFHISKDSRSSPEDKIRLFVAETENIETSSCIISPPQVNFLLNGKGVEKRTNIMMDSGPQIPTIVTPMLKYGSNILQAVGQFPGNYILIIAFMSVTSTPLRPSLQDYVQPATAALDSDSEIIEGPSRISLNCPISFRRIQTPVKGQSCKHLQCFDFDNFMDINSRRPSWRCPHCNQHVCFTDIRIDQNMVKVLKEVGENVADVIFSADGSWKAVEIDDDTNQSHVKTPTSKQDGPTQQENTQDIMDLTQGDDMMDNEIGNFDIEDRKPSITNLTKQGMDNTSENNQNTGSHVEDDFWSGIYLSTYGSGASSSAETIITGGVSLSTPSTQNNALVATSATPNQYSSPTNLQLQPFESSNMSNEYGRIPLIPRHINRSPIAVQALPAQPAGSVPQQRSRTTLNTSNSQDYPLTLDERQQQFSRSHLNPLQLPRTSSSSLQQNLGSQNMFVPIQSTLGGHRTSIQLPTSHRVSPSPALSSHNSQRHQSPLTLRIPNPTTHSLTPARSSAQPPPHLQRTQIDYSGGTQTRPDSTTSTGANRHSRFIAATQRTTQIARQPPSTPVTIQPRLSPSPPMVNADMLRASTQPVTRAEGPVDPATEQNWRPTGRMRGSLSGRAYSDALNQYIIQPTQPAQSARLSSMVPPPPGIPSQRVSNTVPPPPGIPSQPHISLGNSRNASEPSTASEGVGPK